MAIAHINITYERASLLVDDEGRLTVRGEITLDQAEKCIKSLLSYLPKTRFNSMCDRISAMREAREKRERKGYDYE